MVIREKRKPRKREFKSDFEEIGYLFSKHARRKKCV
jgi:hypothetical protein